jgi:hypothetical protein
MLTSLGRWPAARLCLLILSFVAAPSFALDPILPPSGNFDLTHWYLTLPSSETVDPTTLSHGYTRGNTFYTDSRSGGMVFRCPNIAGTTTNSHYSRTELREMLSPLNSSATDDANNWTPAMGGHMKARLRVDRVSTTGDSAKVGRVIIGQIHGPDTEPARLYFHKKPGEAKGRIYLATETVGGSNSLSTDIVSNKNGDGIALGELFTYVIALKDTRLQIDVIRKSGALVNTYIRYIDPAYRGLNLYYKAGVYNQNNTGTTSDYVQATFYSLTHTHP